MQILGNGKMIVLESDLDHENMFCLKCVCGHELQKHSFLHAYGTTSKYITSQCVLCGYHEKDKDHPQGFVCEQFRIGEGVNDARWFNFPGIHEFDRKKRGWLTASDIIEKNKSEIYARVKRALRVP